MLSTRVTISGMTGASALPPGLWPLFFRLVCGSEVPALTTDDERRRIVVGANEEGLLPLLLHDPAVRAVAAELQGVPALRALIAARYRLHAAAAASTVGILGDCMFFKGFDYRHRLYESPELRPSADVDFHLPPAQIPAAIARMAQNGIAQVYSPHPATMAPNYYEVSFDVGQVRVELHRAFNHRVRAAVDEASIWNARESFRFGDVEASRPSPAHALLLHALSLAKDEMAASLIRFVDFWIMLRRWEHELPAVVALARAWRLERALYASLQTVCHVFPDLQSEQIAAAAAQLLTPRARRFLRERVLPDRTRVRSGHRDGRIRQLWRKYWLTDGFTRRAGLAAYSAFAVASSAWRKAMR